MAITNLYSNLPGHLVEFKDGGLSLRNSTVPTGAKSILILGTATDGPINEPVAIDIDTVAKLFGEDYTTDSAGNQVPNGTTLTKYARQAYKAGFSDIRCMRVTGTQAAASIAALASTTEEIKDATPMVIVANGNDVISGSDVEIDWPVDGTWDPANEYPIVTNIQGTYYSQNAGTAGGYGNYANGDKANFLLSSDSVSAKGQIHVTASYALVNTGLKTLTNTDGITIAQNGVESTTGDCIMVITVPADKVADIYDLAWDGQTLGVDGNDNMGVEVEPSEVVEVNGGLYPVYNVIKVNIDGTAITGDVTVDAAGNYLVTFTDAGSAGTPNYSDANTITFEYKNITQELTEANGNGFSTDVAVANFYTPLTVTLEKEAAAGEDIVLYGANGTTVLGKLSDGSGIVTLDAATNTVKVNLSAVAENVSLTNYQVGANLTLGYKYIETVNTTEEVRFVSNYGGSVYNQCSVTVEEITDKDGNVGKLITLTKPQSKLYSTNEAPLQYTSFQYPTFGQLKEAIESNIVSPLNNVFSVETNADDALVANLTAPFSANFAGGTDGINPSNDDYFQALSGTRNEEGYLLQQGAYQILENYSCDYIYVAGIYSDSTVSPKLSVVPQPFHYELALLCAVLTYRTKMTHGFIDVKPNTNTTLVGIQKWVDKLLALPNEFLMRDNEGNIIYDEDNNPMDIGWYTSCVVGAQPLCTSATLGNYYGSPAIAYAALNASLAAYSAPTNKKVPGCSAMRFKLSNKQMNDLTGKRMVCFKYKGEGTSTASTVPYVVDGATCGLKTSDYTRLTTVKVVTQVVDEVREVSDPFIGEPNTVEQRNALAALISKRLSYLKEKGVIQYYEFEISATNYQVLLGECSIALTLVAPQELRKITTVVALRAAA